MMIIVARCQRQYVTTSAAECECCDGKAATRRDSDDGAEYEKIALVSQSMALDDTMSKGSLDQV